MSGDYARWLATESAAALKHDTPRPPVCVSCGKPVERCFDDDYQHSTLEADLACTGPVLPTRAAGKAGE